MDPCSWGRSWPPYATDMFRSIYIYSLVGVQGGGNWTSDLGGGLGLMLLQLKNGASFPAGERFRHAFARCTPAE